MTTPFGFAPTFGFGGGACPFGFSSNWNTQSVQSPFGFSPWSKPFGFNWNSPTSFTPWNSFGFQSTPQGFQNSFGWQQPSFGAPQGFGGFGVTPWNTFGGWNTPSFGSFGFSPMNFGSYPWMTMPQFGGQSFQSNNPWGWTTTGFPTTGYSNTSTPATGFGFMPQQTQPFAQPTNFFGASTPFGFGGWSGFSPFTTSTFGQGFTPGFSAPFSGPFSTGFVPTQNTTPGYTPSTKTGYTPNGQTTPSFGFTPGFGFGGYPMSGFGSTPTPFGFNPFTSYPAPFGYWNTPYSSTGYGFSSPVNYPYPTQGEGETTSPIGVSQRDAA